MELISLKEASERLGVSEQRAPVPAAEGRLRASKIAGRWLVPASSLSDPALRSPAGRPLSQRTVWIYLMDQGSPLTKYLGVTTFDRLAVSGLRRRASSIDLFVHAGAAPALLSDTRVIRTGISALRDHDVDLIVHGEYEGYVRAGHLLDLTLAYGLAESDRPNLLLRYIQDDLWPFPPGMQVAPARVVAVDLISSSDPRTRRAGQELLKQLQDDDQ